MTKVLYVDTSAWVLRYNGAATPSWMKGVPFSSVLVHPETHSALARKAREGSWSSAEQKRMRDQCRQDLDHVHLIELNPEIRALAERLLWQHPLRAADALHLASALMLATELNSAVTLATADVRLTKAARAERIDVIWAGPPEQEPS